MHSHYSYIYIYRSEVDSIVEQVFREKHRCTELEEVLH